MRHSRFQDILLLSKIKLVYFVMISGVAGYALGWQIENQFVWWDFVAFLLGLLFITMGSFALNQAQEKQLDANMPRTKERPVAAGRMSVSEALLWSSLFLLLGSVFLWQVGWVPLALGWFTVLLYNLFYTLIWKPKWIFGAVPGAIPGAMPVVIGYSALHPKFYTTECLYAFLIMFLWQMPHFWSLAIKFKEDYKSGGIPVLPSELGVERALGHMALYTISYVCLAVLSPLFLPVVYYMYWVVVIPFALMVAKEFYRYYRAEGKQHWLSFFLWTNFSMLVFLLAPVGDRWLFLWIKT